MSSVSYKQTPLTISNIVLISGVFVSTFSASVQPRISSGEPLPAPHQNTYHYFSDYPSFKHIEELFIRQTLDISEREFLEAVSSFYGQLVEKQEPLGQEFAQVLADNLWDLYEG